MLNVTSGQWGVFLAFLWLGAILSVLYTLFRFNGKGKYIFDFVFITLGGALFIYFMHIYNLGNFRLYLLLGLGLGISIEKIFISKTLAHIKNLLYNILAKKIADIKQNVILRKKKTEDKKSQKLMKKKQNKENKLTNKQKNKSSKLIKREQKEENKS